jgi:hypothetical protein
MKNSRKNLRKFKVTHKRRYLKIWDNEIEEIINKIKIAYIIWLNIKAFRVK